MGYVCKGGGGQTGQKREKERKEFRQLFAVLFIRDLHQKKFSLLCEW